MSQETLRAVQLWGKDLISPGEGESVEYLNWPHSKLLAEAWESLNQELQGNGNTPRFLELRTEHSKRLIKWWEAKARKYFDRGVPEKQEFFERWKVFGDERISVLPLEVYEDEDEKFLQIKRRTSLEEDEVSVAIRLDHGAGGYVLDDFLHPPKIESKISLEPQELLVFHYKIIFRRGRIGTIERLEVFEDPNNELPYIKKIEVIDCSIFGVEAR